MARVSNTPGRTREINFFKLGAKLILVDLPGYGYAKASKALAAEWQKLIFAYLARAAELAPGGASDRRAARRDGEIDREVMELLDHSGGLLSSSC